MARTFSAALFLAAFRSNLYAAEFWDGASPLSPSLPPIPGQKRLLLLLMLLLLSYGTLIIANTVHARPSRTGSPARVACPMQAEHTHGCVRDNARSSPRANQPHAIPHTGGCTRNVSLQLNLTKELGNRIRDKSCFVTTPSFLRVVAVCG